MSIYSTDSPNFSNDLNAARFLLHEATSIFAETNIVFAVLGGWTPYLLCPGPIPHPGTFDVDILLPDKCSRNDVKNAVAVFESNGYVVGAKNLFQLYRLLHVDSKPTIFHVDFLHRFYAPDQEDFTINWGGVESIAGPASDLVLEYGENRTLCVDLLTKAETPTRKQLIFPSEAAFIAMKARSMSSPKRVRDPFDVYITITQSADLPQLLADCKRLLHDQSIFRASWAALKQHVAHEESVRRIVGWLQKQAPNKFTNEDDTQQIVKDDLMDFIQKVEHEHG